MIYLTRIKRKLLSLSTSIKQYKCKALSRNYNLGGDFQRVYFYHIRKTGGTSINHMFLSLSDRKSERTYHELAGQSSHRLIINGKVFVGWNRQLIEQGYYFYAFSHAPYHALDLPRKTFTITCLRDPVQRVLSHYKMLLAYRQSGEFRPDYEEEAGWLGNSLGEFLDNIPREHLLRQLYTFSEAFDVDEAFENIVNLSHYFFTEAFSQGIADLAKKTGLALEPIHIRKSSIQFQPKESDLARLRSVVEPEFELYRRLRQAYEPVDGEKSE